MNNFNEISAVGLYANISNKEENDLNLWLRHIRKLKRYLWNKLFIFCLRYWGQVRILCWLPLCVGNIPLSHNQITFSRFLGSEIWSKRQCIRKPLIQMNCIKLNLMPEVRLDHLIILKQHEKNISGEAF